MKRFVLILGLVCGLALFLYAFTANTKDDGCKVKICHIPPGNPDNAHTIEVSENAVPAHLAHGDTEGECPCNYGG